jgi:hypothetical protein
VAPLFSDWLLGRVVGAATSAVRAVVAEERSRSALDGCARRALASAVARQHEGLGEGQVEAMGSGLAELLWCNGDSIPLADRQTSLWARFRAGVAASFSVLDRTQTDEGIAQAEAMGLDPTLLAEHFVDAFYRQLETAAAKPGTGGDSIKALWQVLAEGRDESGQEAMLESMAQVDRRLTAIQGSDDRPADTHDLADELLRGPLRARGLDLVVKEADRLAPEDPVGAAERLAHVTEDLADAGFSPLADGMRRRTAQLLVAAGRPEKAAGLLENMVWQSVEAGGQSLDRRTLRELRELADDQDLPTTVFFIGMIDLIDQWYGGIDEDVGKFVPPLRELVDVDHPSLDRLVLWGAETAVAFGQLEVLDGQLGEFLRQVVSRRSSEGPDDEVAVRARLCLVDATGETKDLARHARRGELAPRLATLVFARLGRYHAWHGQSDQADDAYREAIKQACAANLPREAAQAVRSLARVQWVYAASLSEEWFQAPGLAARVEGTGTGSLFERRRDPLDAGLVALANERLRDAVRHLRTSLRDHATAGHLQAELNAHTALMRVFSQADPMLAVTHAIAGGNVNELKELLPLDRYLDVRQHLQALAPWERATALFAMSLQGDLVPDIDVEGLVNLALASTEFTGQGFLGPQVWLNAWRAIAAVAGRLTPPQAKRALVGLKPYVQRDPGKYHYHDDEHVRIACAIHETQPGLRTDAREHLLTLLEQGDEVAATTARSAAAGFKEEVDAVAFRLERLVEAGNRASLDLLLALGLPHPRLVSEAAAAVERVLSRCPEPPGVFSFGTDLAHSASLARVLDESPRVELARHLLAVGEDRHRPEANRSEAIRALGNLAETLPAGVRDEAFARCMAIVEDPGPPHELDQLLQGGLHPLSAVQINLWFGSLIPHALVTASVLAQQADQWGSILATAAPLLLSSSEPGVAGAARALWRIPLELVTLDLSMLARAPSPIVRQLAAVLWAHRPEEGPDLGPILARDTDVRVRAALGSELAALAEADAGVAEEVAEILRDDPSWSIRELVEGVHAQRC